MDDICDKMIALAKSYINSKDEDKTKDCKKKKR